MALQGWSPSYLQEGMEVVGSDGNRVGRVKEVRDSDFLVDRSPQRDVYVPFDAVQAVVDGRVVLNVPAGQVGYTDWPNPALTEQLP